MGEGEEELVIAALVVFVAAVAVVVATVMG